MPLAGPGISTTCPSSGAESFRDWTVMAPGARASLPGPVRAAPSTCEVAGRLPESRKPRGWRGSIASDWAAAGPLTGEGPAVVLSNVRRGLSEPSTRTGGGDCVLEEMVRAEASSERDRAPCSSGPERRALRREGSPSFRRRGSSHLHEPLEPSAARIRGAGQPFVSGSAGAAAQRSPGAHGTTGRRTQARSSAAAPSCTYTPRLPPSLRDLGNHA